MAFGQLPLVDVMDQHLVMTWSFMTMQIQMLTPAHILVTPTKSHLDTLLNKPTQTPSLQGVTNSLRQKSKCYT